ncbi:Short-chain dehydrogenase/reductase family protein [Mycena venus]|uniref:Short-chain dehydrogenase/reductase family protein n=1 Tax=Mycena venus TaxID=2733690 RepID=A0A8H6YSR3_9AGAR|nr:Short-chain dehydrogenase/reductase family protein [Mycena venus]
MHANLVIITGYNAERLKLAEDTIKKETPFANIRPLTLDLSSLSSVREAAAEVNAIPGPLHVLIHNAAATIGQFKLTVDNLECQIATNHIGPFLFTKLLAPKILAARTAHYTPRVVFVSTFAHGLVTGVNFNTLGRPDPAIYDAMDSYYQSKAANVLSAIELSKRSKGQINSYSLNPGAIFTNIMQKGEATAAMQKMGVLDADGQPSSEIFKTIPQGASTTLVAAFDPTLNDKPGAYLDDCVVFNEPIPPGSSDRANAEKLWTVTEEIIGETFTF